MPSIRTTPTQPSKVGLDALGPAFECADQGVVLIDPQMIVRFVSPKARSLWRLSPEQCDSDPPFSEFIYNIAAAGAYDIDPDALEEYVLERFASVQSGDPTPVDIRVTGNRVVRAQCTVLPDGCRLLTHTDVTDLVLRAEYFRELANVDALTGLPNRHGFLNRGEAEWLRFRRYHHSFSVITACVEGLQSIHDEFGAEVVNRAILHVAAVCVREQRTTDLVARLASSKFGILMPHTTVEEARILADRLRTALSCYPLYVDETPLRLFISLGVAESKPELSGVAALLKAADEYRCVARDGRMDADQRSPRLVPPPLN